ncbi:MAG: PAS domain S-box protein [Chitinophagaceae bacterium]
MLFNQLLQKQLNQYVPDEQLGQEWFRDFLKTVNDSYEAFEKERGISDKDEARKKSEILLKQSEKRMRLALQIIEDNVWEYDFEKRKMIFAQTETSILKLDRTEYVGDENKEWWKSIYEEDIFVATDIFRKYNKGEISNHSIEYRMYCRDGSVKWVSNRGGIIQRDNNGKTMKVIGSLADIDKLKKVQAELAATADRLTQSELRLRTALEKIGDNVWEHNFTTGEIYFSNTKNHLLGFETSEYSSNAELWWSRVHPDERAILENNNKLYNTAAIDHHSLEYRLIHKDGSVKWVLDRGVVIEKADDGKPIRVIGTHTDITQRKIAEQVIALSEEKYRSIIANMNLGLLEVDNEERIHYANHSFCKMSGYTEEELINKKASLLFARGANSEILESKNEMRRKGMSDAYEMAVKNKRGQIKWWLISGAPRYNDKGELVGSIGIHLDITDQKKLELDLVDAREAAEQSARSKETFLANMSHEIRTPMNAILGMGRQLATTPLSEKQQFYLKTINTAGEHLLIVINDILDISKIEAGKLQLENIGFKPAEAIKHCIRVMTHRAEEKGLDLSLDIDEHISPVLIGDPYRLNQVLLNLLSNAIKFTEKGKVSLSGHLKSDDRNRQWLTIKVDDTGIGMDELFLDNIFQKFTQEDRTTARKFGGTGLGMSISKQLIELMDGTITVESKKEKGTCVTVVIPFFAGTEEDLPKQERHNTDSAVILQKKILLVEDNEMNRLVATTVLKKYGAVIKEVINGKEAVDELRHTNYDIILMDVQMPVMDGLEATAAIRNELKSKTPIIAITANAIKGESDRCLQSGMNDYISKPFDEQDLVNAIAYWLEPTIKREKVMSEKEQVEKLYDLTKLIKISSGNKEFVNKMSALFIAQTPASVKEIRAAYDRNDFDTIRSVAHRIRPGIDNMGIGSLYQDVRDIEILASNEPNSSRLDGLITRLEEVINIVVIQLESN